MAAGWKDETIFSTATGTDLQGWMDGMAAGWKDEMIFSTATGTGLQG